MCNSYMLQFIDHLKAFFMPSALAALILRSSKELRVLISSVDHLVALAPSPDEVSLWFASVHLMLCHDTFLYSAHFAC